MNELTRSPRGSMVASSDEQAILVSRSDALDRDGLLLVLWRRRLIVAVTTVLALIASLVYLLVAQPLYTSTARIYVQQTGPRLLATEAEKIAPLDESYLFTQAEFLRSNPIIGPVVEKPEIRRMQRLQGAGNLVTFLKKYLEVSVGRKDHIINVAFDAPDPNEAAQLVNAVVESYVSYNRGRNRSTATELVDVLRREKEKRDEELAAKAKEAFEYKVANGTLSFESDHGNVIVERLARLSDALTEAELAVINAKSNYEAARAMGLSAAGMRRLIEAQHMDSATTGGSAEAEEREARAELRRMEVQLTLQSAKYGDGHPALRALRVGLEERRAQILKRDKEFCEAYVAAAQATLLTAEQKAKEIHAQVDEQQKRAMELNAKAAEYTRLESERNRMEKLCDALDARMKELNIAQYGGVFNIHVLEPAQPEEKPSKPSRATTVGIGLLLGLMLGIGLALVQEGRDQRLHSADEIHATLELPLLGVVPHMNGRATPGQKGRIVHLQPMSAAAEAYRTLRTAVHFGAPAGMAKTLLFTSPGPGDGKSTAASNLAIAMAQAGRKVLLLDADCRKPRQHSIFGLEEGSGFCSVLGDESAIEQAIRPSGIENLDVLPCGAVPPNPAELLNGELFGQMVSALRDRYDHVVIDSPPAGVVTDAQILSAMADVTILVLRAQSTTRHGARHARDRLLSVGGRLLGVLVNDVPHRRGSAGYYAYSSYGGSRPGMDGPDRDNRPPLEQHRRSSVAFTLPHKREGDDP